MKALVLAGVLAALAGLGPAQEHYVAYPIDALHGSFGQVIPLGNYNMPMFDEARSQLLVPAPFLPSTGGPISALEVSPMVEGTVRYSTLVISMGHTTRPALDRVYATNLPDPTVVFRRQAFTIAYPSKTAWVRLPFPSPFLYDGRRNLVIEIQKQIDRTVATRAVGHQTTVFPVRADLPRPLYAAGRLGSRKFYASYGDLYEPRSRLQLRLRFAGTPTLTVASTRRPGRDYFHLGATVTLTVQDTAGKVYFDLLDVGLRPAPISLPGVAGRYWLQIMFLIFASGTIPPGGRAAVGLTIPEAPAVVGTHVRFQAATVGSTRALTNTVDGFIAR